MLIVVDRANTSGPLPLSSSHIINIKGHRLKNLNCRLIQELKKYDTANRLLLTGTPLQVSAGYGLRERLHWAVAMIADCVYAFYHLHAIAYWDFIVVHYNIINESNSSHLTLLMIPMLA